MKDWKEMPYSTLLDYWLISEKIPDKENNFRAYALAIDRYIIPAFKGLLAAEINTRLINKAVRTWSEEGDPRTGMVLSANTIEQNLEIIRQSLDFYAGKVKAEPLEFSQVEGPGPDKYEIFTRYEVGMIEKGIFAGEITPVSVAIALALYGGLRVKDICNLMWEDIDFENEVIHIRPYSPPDDDSLLEDNGIRGYRKSPSATSKRRKKERTVPLISTLSELLEEIMPENTAGIFVVSMKDKPTYDSAIRSAYKTFLKQNNITRRRFSCLRNTYAIIAIRSGMPWDVLAENIGMYSLAGIIDHYSKPSMKDMQYEMMAFDGCWPISRKPMPVDGW